MIRFVTLLLFLCTLLSASKSAQMIMVGFSGQSAQDRWVGQIFKDIQKERIGGLLIGADNIKSKKQLKSLIQSIRAQDTNNHIIIAINPQSLLNKQGFEGLAFLKNMAKDKSLDEAYREYEFLAKEIKDLGIDMVFAPSLDMDLSKNESFSSQEEIVIAYANVFMRAFEKADLICVPKHFPGETMPWEYKQLKPYFELISKQKAQAVMLSNAIINRLDAKNPAFMSGQIVTEILRQQLGFTGIVLSDDLKSERIRENYLLKESVVGAINAGVDMLVFSSYFSKNSNIPRRVTEIINEALQSGDIKTESIEKSYARITQMKKKR